MKKWGIVGIGLMDWDRKMYNTLKSQDTLYTVLSRGHTGSEARVVGSIVDFMFAPEDHQAVIDKVRKAEYPCRGVGSRDVSLELGHGTAVGIGDRRRL